VRGGGRQAGSYAAALFDAEMDGFKFTKVDKDGRAAKMGIQVDDVLTKANGEELTAMFQIFSIARDLGDDAKTMTLELKRGDAKVQVKLDLEEVRKASARRGRGAGGQQGAGNGDAPRGGETRGGEQRGGEQSGTGERRGGELLELMSVR